MSNIPNKDEQYKCQSYYNDENELVDCTCGKCGIVEEIDAPASYFGSYEGHTIDIERDKEHNNDFYIRVYNDEGYVYDGWWDQSADATIEEAINEAKDGALLDSKEDEYVRYRSSQIDILTPTQKDKGEL